MFVTKRGIDELAPVYKAKYGKELWGANLGQMDTHTHTPDTPSPHARNKQKCYKRRYK